MNTFKVILIFIALFAGALAITAGINHSDNRNITEWVRSQGETATNIERRMLDIGPYFLVKDARYYRVQTNKNVYWVKYLWGRTIKKEVGNKYETVD